MKDPHDNSTLDLVEEAKRQKLREQNARRQERLRTKRRIERQEGKRVELSLQSGEVALLREVLKGCRGRRDAVELLLRLPNVADTCSRSDAAEDSASWPARSAYQVRMGYVAAGAYRNTPAGQPEVDDLVKPGDVVWTNYDTGPYLVKAVRRHDYQVSEQHDLGGLQSFSLVLNSMDKRGADCGINELVSVDGRLLKLFANNDDEVFVASTSARDGHAIRFDFDVLREALAKGEAEGRALLETLRVSGAQVVPNSPEAAPVAKAEPTVDGERDYRLDQQDVALLLWCIDDHLTIRDDLHQMEAPSFRGLVEKLVEGSPWAGIVETMGKSEGVLNIVQRYKDEASRWQRAYKEEFDRSRKRAEEAGAHIEQRRAAELGPLQRELEALRREKELLESERNQAFAANKVLEQRLRDAGLSTEYR